MNCYWRIGVLAAVVAFGGILANQALGRVEGEVLTGQPFGVGRVTITAPEVAIDANRILIHERDGRVFFPATATGALGKLIGQLLGNPTDQPASGATIHFLFRGNEPLELTVFAPQAVKLTLQPQAGNPRAYDRQMTAWWREYNAAAREQQTQDDFPPLVQTYLLTMLEQRLGREPPLLERIKREEPPVLMTRSLELLTGMERLRLETLKNTMQGRGDFGQPADQPLPPEARWTPAELPADLAAVPIEEIARHVPQECFYIRFGKFSNYVWLNSLIDEYGGDLTSMITLRSYAAPMNKRSQQQLALEQNALAKIVGDAVIADVAIIGRDTFSKEGAAIGILFEAKNEVLASDLETQRKKALNLEKENGATDVIVQVAGRDVSFLSTPDNRVRSFYAVDGNYHLVTTSRHIVERFFAVSGGAGSLGESAEFRYARQTMPLDRKDTIFVYFSTAFFGGLLSPQYQIELERRMKSVTDMELVMLAGLAAEGEGVRGDTIDDLIQAGLLPRGMGTRPDGSGPTVSEGRIVDSRRGLRGYFTPIPDMEIAGITREEAARIESLNAAYARDWRRLDPLMVGIRRTALPNDRERLVIDGELAPLDESKYGWVLSILGPPTREMMTSPEGDVVSLQMSARGGVLLPSIPPHHLFLGIQDLASLTTPQPSGLFQTLKLLQSTPGYIGGWPKPGFLDLLPFNLGGTVPDANGFSRLPFGLWRRQGGGLSVLSFDPQILASVTPQLRVVEAETEAQIRLHVADLSQSKVMPWVNNLYYGRALQASAGNARFLHQLNQQLHIPMADAKQTAEDLLDAQLICPLGGKFECVEELGGTQVWQSTAWADKELTKVPDDFQAPLLKWFRGADAHVIKLDDRLIAHAELDLQRKPSEPKIQLPNFFDLFGGGQKAVKPKDKPKDAGNELPPPLPPVAKPPLLEPPTIELPAPAPAPAPKPRGVER